MKLWMRKTHSMKVSVQIKTEMTLSPRSSFQVALQVAKIPMNCCSASREPLTRLPSGDIYWSVVGKLGSDIQEGCGRAVG